MNNTNTEYFVFCVNKTNTEYLVFCVNNMHTEYFVFCVKCSAFVNLYMTSHIHTVNNINKSVVRQSWISSVVLDIYSSKLTNMFSCKHTDKKGAVVVMILW